MQYWGINGSEPSAGTVSPNEIYTVKYNDKEGALIVNNTVLSSTDFTPNKEEIIYIGHKIYQQEHSRAKFYSIKIYDKETQILVRDFIPVLDKEGTPCLYDKVEKKFYYNQGTGEFEYK